MIATDNHMGFREKEQIGVDSFDSFEEVLELANQQKVDFVLLGGDLFHDHRPSASTYFKASKIFNEHVFG